MNAPCWAIALYPEQPIRKISSLYWTDLYWMKIFIFLYSSFQNIVKTLLKLLSKVHRVNRVLINQNVYIYSKNIFLVLLQEIGKVSNKIHERNLTNRKKCVFFKYFRIRRCQIILCTNRRFDISSPTSAHGTSSVTCCETPAGPRDGHWEEQSRGRHWKSSASSRTEVEIGSWGQSQRAEEALCLGTLGANFQLDPTSQASAKSGVNLSSVPLKPVFLLSLIDWFSSAPSDRATVSRQKGKPLLFENLPEDKHFVGCYSKWVTRI